ncbi:DNA primase [Tropicimonas sp. IMCC6043]|uniref:DNA primase n=1 Tax=Tropicimonas sp. IMCC6043 TaxID=2510645 RepID=UPI00101C8F57|nr:DNA primase [Tropicimonas sp. IMCC6043]RYH08413.1 DNA primase [Tropicimonas sp. IMCC6043]
MSLPDGFLDELRSRTSLAQVVGRKVVWDQRKSNQAKGDHWAPCPFHQEKTASFHVDDRKGFFHCFGCHESGDTISFVQKTENVSFIEAIEILAGEAGMEMPARDPRAREKADRKSQLAEVMEAATKFFRLQLKTAAGGQARAYLSEKRGLSAAALDRWEIGFAPPGWQNLWDHLRGKGIAPELILSAGLAKPSDKGREPYDTFRNRIMFPIRDGRGRAIAFGGRAMDPSDSAKYLNSPETDLFDKGRNLYNFGPAREAAGKGQPLLVAEGYMDVIALSEAGFGATVAGLGTAITEAQLQLMWRVDDEPVIALDGDTAGLRAAMRLIDLALPLIEAGKSLRFCLLPEGQDPDDLLKARGPEAMQALIDAAVPMVSLLWRRETESKVLDSPERRAKLDTALRAAIKRIRDPGLRGHYAEEIRRLRAELFGLSYGPVGQAGMGAERNARPPWKKGGWRAAPVAAPVSGTLSSRLAGADEGVALELREAVILATLIGTPTLLEEFCHVLEEMPFEGPGHAELAAVLLTCDPEDTAPEVEARIAAALGPQALERVRSERHVTLAPSVRRAGDLDLARLCLEEEIVKLAALRGTRREIDEAMEGFGETSAEWIDHRLALSVEARQMAGRSSDGDRADFVIAENGARMDRGERSELDRLLKSIGFLAEDKDGGGET